MYLQNFLQVNLIRSGISRIPSRTLSRAFSSKVNTFPFNVDIDKAKSILQKDKGLFEKSEMYNLNSDSNDVSLSRNKEKIQKKYIPFISASVFGLRTEYSAQIGKDKTEYYWTVMPLTNGKTTYWQPVQRARTYTVWYDVEKIAPKTDYPIGTVDTQIYAGFDYPSNFVENSLRTNDLIDLEYLYADMNSEVENHNMNHAFATEKMVSELHKLEVLRIKSFLKTEYLADRVRVKQTTLRMDKANIKMIKYHIPAYVLEHDDNDKKYLKIVSGHTGKIEGDRVYSPTISGLTGSAVGLLLGAGFLVTRFSPLGIYLTMGQFIIQMGLSTGIFGVTTAYWAKWKTYSNYKDTRQQIEDDRKLHDQYSSKYDDGSFEEEINSNDKTFKSYPKDECKILGLNPNVRIDKSTLKKVYREKLKIYHPDIYPGNKQFANDVTSRLNRAYEILSDLVDK